MSGRGGWLANTSRDITLVNSRPGQITISVANGSRTREFGAQVRLAHPLANHESPRGADVDGTEMLQLVGELLRPEGPVTADVDAPQQNDVCHRVLRMFSMRQDPSPDQEDGLEAIPRIALGVKPAS